MVASFDLHVLSTPPAFILSQDQTLMLKFVIFRCPVQFLNWQINRINLRFIPLNVIERIYCFKVVSFKETFVCCYYSTLKFIESFKVISLFNYQSSFLIAFVSLTISLIILTRFKVFVNTFFKLFFKQRRRRDLNPRAAINDLHPFQGCPFGQLGYFSELYSQPVVANLSL